MEGYEVGRGWSVLIGVCGVVDGDVEKLKFGLGVGVPVGGVDA